MDVGKEYSIKSGVTW